VKTIPIRTIENPKTASDPILAAAKERVQKAVRLLQEQGIIDAEGNRIRQDLPPDMQEGQDRDLGG
jgi:uncharacterized protein YceH (UPF0502 family)